MGNPVGYEQTYRYHRCLLFLWITPPQHFASTTIRHLICYLTEGTSLSFNNVCILFPFCPFLRSPSFIWQFIKFVIILSTEGKISPPKVFFPCHTTKWWLWWDFLRLELCKTDFPKLWNTSTVSNYLNQIKVNMYRETRGSCLRTGNVWFTPATGWKLKLSHQTHSHMFNLFAINQISLIDLMTFEIRFPKWMKSKLVTLRRFFRLKSKNFHSRTSNIAVIFFTGRIHRIWGGTDTKARSMGHNGNRQRSFNKGLSIVAATPLQSSSAVEPSSTAFLTVLRQARLDANF